MQEDVVTGNIANGDLFTGRVAVDFEYRPGREPLFTIWWGLGPGWPITFAEPAPPQIDGQPERLGTQGNWAYTLEDLLHPTTTDAQDRFIRNAADLWTATTHPHISDPDTRLVLVFLHETEHAVHDRHTERNELLNQINKLDTELHELQRFAGTLADTIT